MSDFDKGEQPTPAGLDGWRDYTAKLEDEVSEILGHLSAAMRERAALRTQILKTGFGTEVFKNGFDPDALDEAA